MEGSKTRRHVEKAKITDEGESTSEEEFEDEGDKKHGRAPKKRLIKLKEGEGTKAKTGIRLQLQ